MEESGFQFKNVANQYFATLAANLIMLGHGCVIGWVGPSLPILISDDTPLEGGPLNNEELSWLGSINNLGALCGILTFGFITSWLGCKKSMLFLALPSAAFWFLVFFGSSYSHILFARFFTGWAGGGINTTIVLYISEISNDNIRGKLSSFTTLSRNMGVLIIFIAGAYVNYYLIPCIFVLFPIVYLIVFGTMLPNTSQYHLRKGQTEAAKNALKFYKGYKGITEQEVNAFDKEFNRLQLLAKEQKEDERLHFSDFTERESIKGHPLGLVESISWCVSLFELWCSNLRQGASNMDPLASSIALAFFQMAGGIFSTQLAELGRKLSMIVSFMGSAIGLFILSVYLYFDENGYDLSSYSWLPVVCLSFVMFISSAGVYALYAVCFVEHLPSKIRTIGLTICILFVYMFAFLFIKLFPILLETIGLGMCLAILCVGSVFGAFFVIFASEETK